MDAQLLIVSLILLIAIAFAGRAIYRRTRSFSPKSGCDADCGCGGESQKLSSKPV
jgi:hypothetical protein